MKTIILLFSNPRLVAAAPDLYNAGRQALDVMPTGPQKDALVDALLKANASRGFRTMLLVLMLAVSLWGCGHEMPTTEAPDPTPNSPSVAANDPTPTPTATSTPTPTATPTATPTPNPTVQTFIYQDTTICAFLHSWNPNTVTIKTYASVSNGPTYFLLTWQGAFLYNTTNCINGCVSPDITFTRSTINATVCTFSVHNGQYAGVTP